MRFFLWAGSLACRAAVVESARRATAGGGSEPGRRSREARRPAAELDVASADGRASAVTRSLSASGSMAGRGR